MQPIAVGVGLTVTILALTALLAGPHVAYLAPHTRVLLAAYWPSLTAYSTLAVLTLIVALYATARAAGLADLGRNTTTFRTSNPRDPRELPAASLKHVGELGRELAPAVIRGNYPRPHWSRARGHAVLEPTTSCDSRAEPTDCSSGGNAGLARSAVLSLDPRRAHNPPDAS